MEHPTLLRMAEALAARQPRSPKAWTVEAVREMALVAGADDAGLVSLDDPALDDQRDFILRAMPQAKSLVALVRRMAQGNLRSTERSLANLEFHHKGDDLNAVASRLVDALEAQGVGAMNPPVGFPMEMARFPGRTWVVSHKPVAVAAGLGRIGLHRNLIHPRFGNFVLLATVLTDLELEAPARPIDFNPCFSCKLCVAACPVGAIEPDGRFHFSSCMTHNYREFMTGFTDWAEQVADSGSAKGLRQRVSASESVSMWQSLAFGPNYKAAYCLSVCPAGEEVIGPYLEDKAGHVRRVLRPFQEKVETLYVVKGSDAEAFAKKRYPHKPLRHVHTGLRPTSVSGFLFGMGLAFQEGPAQGLDATYHFVFTGPEATEATIRIQGGRLSWSPGLEGEAQLRVRADGAAWLAFLAGDLGLPKALLTGKIRLKGHPKWLLAFGRCFPT